MKILSPVSHAEIFYQLDHPKAAKYNFSAVLWNKGTRPASNNSEVP